MGNYKPQGELYTRLTFHPKEIEEEWAIIKIQVNYTQDQFFDQKKFSYKMPKKQ